MADLDEIAEELERAGQMSNDELGEWWIGLASLLPRVRDGASLDFKKAYAKQLRSEYKRLKNEFRIVETTETQTITSRELRHFTE